MDLPRDCWAFPDASFAERVTATADGRFIIASSLVLIEEATEDCRNSCGHIGVWDEHGFLYDFRCCAVCGVGLGTV